MRAFLNSTRTVPRCLVSAVLAPCATLLAAAPAASGGTVALDPEAAQYEPQYMRFTADHHAMGVEMADICLGNAQSDTLEGVCGSIRESQSEQIATLQQWLSEWYGEPYTPVIDEAGQADLKMLQGLDGREFDVEISQMFIEHHEQIIARSQDALNFVEHEELRNLASTIIAEQSAEIPVFQSVIVGTDGGGGGGTVIPLPAPVAMGAVGLAGAAAASVRARRRA